jgi:twinkle protein
MISRQNLATRSGNSNFDKFDAQDIAIEKFRKFATERNVHLSLVVHPRKEDESARLGISSIYGSAKATQEADNVLILQKDNQKKYLDVRKNRFSGDLGATEIFFDRATNRYTEAPTHHVVTPKITSKPPTASIEDHWDKYFSSQITGNR